MVIKAFLAASIFFAFVGASLLCLDRPIVLSSRLGRSTFVCVNVVNKCVYVGAVKSASPFSISAVTSHTYLNTQQWAIEWQGSQYLEIANLGMGSYVGISSPEGPGFNPDFDLRIERNQNSVFSGWAFKVYTFLLAITTVDQGGVSVLTRKWVYRDIEGTKLQLQLPWLLFVLAAIAGSVPYAISTYRKQKLERLSASNKCYACGYNLTANASGICPECGTKIEPKEKATLLDD